MNRLETESFFKSFFIFFFSLLSVSALALYLYTNEQEQFYYEKMLSTMDAFSYSMKGKQFSYEIIPFTTQVKIHELIITNNEIYALFPWPKNPHISLIKVIYPYSSYIQGVHEQERKGMILFVVIAVIISLLSLLFSRYSLFPLRKSLIIMEDFLKDIIHDLNTPVTSILLNSQLLKRKYDDEEIDRIYISGQTITGLYKNLEVLYRELPIQQHNVILDLFLRERVQYFQTLYPALVFTLNGEFGLNITINKEIFMRIVDNLLSNACKYNHSKGRVDIYYDARSIKIIDTGFGIKNVNKVFNRFYKETERGLGIGLHIVKTLSKKINIKILIKSQENIGTSVTILFDSNSPSVDQ
ncbi:MAG: HAMP domain-containing sensor histidine kinase [Thiovulaceae bacterium]|nr:HAMP domain-containing sensor histidine kinase [Sulfurimonadaceae bacterium]